MKYVPIYVVNLEPGDSDWLMEKEFRWRGYAPLISRALKSDVDENRLAALMQEHTTANADLNLAKNAIARKYIPEEYLTNPETYWTANFALGMLTVFGAEHE